MNAENLLFLIGHIDERFIEEAAPHKNSEIIMTASPKKPTVIFRKALQIAACVAVIIAALFLIQNRNELISTPELSGTESPIVCEITPAQTIVTTVPETTVTAAVSTENTIQHNDDIIHINELGYAPWMSGPFPPLDENLVPMAFEEIELYYGTVITPGYLPQDIVYEDFFTEQNPNGKRGIYKNASDEIIYDKYSLTYLSAAATTYYKENGRFETLTPKGVYINVGKLTGIGTGIRWDDEGIKTSEIGGNEVLLASYKVDVMHFFAVFDKDDVHFAIEAVDIPESEFLKVVGSYMAN